MLEETSHEPGGEYFPYPNGAGNPDSSAPYLMWTRVRREYAPNRAFPTDGERRNRTFDNPYRTAHTDPGQAAIWMVLAS